jgi:hypothetical protein
MNLGSNLDTRWDNHNQPLTRFFVSGFLFVARFLPGFGGIFDNWD